MSHLVRDGDGTATARQLPLEIAEDTFLLRAAMPSVGGTFTNLNSMLIRGAEPIVVDTGMVTDRQTWFEDLFSLVAPEELRWIFVTHNDTDHSGNLLEALERCPNAKVITSRGESFRTHASFGIGWDRLRIVESDEPLDLGDRVAMPVRPPVYDSPYTRGLFDHATRVFYASDAFCAPMPDGPVDRVDEIDPALWAEGFSRFHHASLCPWVALVDKTAFRSQVDRIAALDPCTIASAHSPLIGSASVRQALDLMAALPEAAPAPIDWASPEQG